MTNQDRELIEAWRAVANAKLAEYRRQSWRLALLVRQGALERAAAVDRLWEIATAHALVCALGEDRIQAILDEAFAGADFRPVQQEVA
jgi:pantothenate kinase-related protein Tda10